MRLRPDIDRAQLVMEYTGGISLNTLAKKYRADYRTLQRLLRKAGVTVRSNAEGRRMTARSQRDSYQHPDAEAIVEAYKAGDSQLTIADRFHLSVRSVCKLVYRAGVHRRDLAEAKAASLARMSAEERATLTAPARERRQEKRREADAAIDLSWPSDRAPTPS